MWRRNIKSNWFREIKYCKGSQIKRDTKIISQIMLKSASPQLEEWLIKYLLKELIHQDD